MNAGGHSPNFPTSFAVGAQLSVVASGGPLDFSRVLFTNAAFFSRDAESPGSAGSALHSPRERGQRSGSLLSGGCRRLGPRERLVEERIAALALGAVEQRIKERHEQTGRFNDTPDLVVKPLYETTARAARTRVGRWSSARRRHSRTAVEKGAGDRGKRSAKI